MADKTTKIAKNTLALYIRSLVVMCIMLYTSRATLQVLGVVDFGIYCVVGGIIGMLSFLNNSMMTTLQRYFNVDLGRKDEAKLILDFRTSLTIQLFIGIVVIILGETVGIWWLENKMVIPDERMIAARWIYQVSILSFLLAVFSAPFSALIVAFEQMRVYAIISVVEAVLKLVIVLLLPHFLVDHLILYAILIMAIAVLNFFLYLIYCKRKFACTTLSFLWNKQYLIEMASFSGWSLYGSISYTLRDTGVNLLLNLFFGPVVNAARGVAIQVNNAVNQFVTNFQTSFRPQLTQSYASGDKVYMEKIYFSATKLSFYLIFCICLPLFLEMDYVLNLWLGDNVPDDTAVFTKIILCTTSISAFINPTTTIAYATGKIRYFSIMVGSLNMLIVPVAYLFLRLGYGSTSAFVVTLTITIFVQIVRLSITSRLADISLLAYARSVVLPILYSCLLSVALPLAFVSIVADASFARLIATCAISVLSAALCIWFLGLSGIEKSLIRDKTHKLRSKILRM